MSNIDSKIYAIIAIINEQRPISKREYQTTLGELDSRIAKFEREKLALGRILPILIGDFSKIKRINDSLDRLYKLRDEFIARCGMNTYDDSPSKFELPLEYLDLPYL